MLKDTTKNLQDKNRRIEVLLKTGQRCGKKFGKHFRTQMYPTDAILKKISSLKNFSDLTETERLTLWSDYDSDTGWGKISVSLKGRNLIIKAIHPNLFSGEGGECFSYLMAGYSESVVNEIMSDLNSKSNSRYDFQINSIQRSETEISFLLNLVTPSAS
jgi:hypothetical protein